MPRFSITLIPLSGLKLNKSESGKKTPTIKEKNKGDIELVNEKINQYVFVKDLGKFRIFFLYFSNFIFFKLEKMGKPEF